jgi:hypothetical protein
MNYQQVKDKEEAYGKIKEAITPELLAKYKVKPSFEYLEDKIIASGKGFTLTMNFYADHLNYDLKLSLLLKPLKGKITESIDRKIQRII